MKRLILLGIMAGICMGCHQIRDRRSLKLAHGLDTQHPVHLAMVKFAETCDEISNGKLKVDIYPSQQLGTERETLELLQLGSIAITKVSAGVLENFAPSTQVLGLPYVFKSRAHQYAVLDGPVGDSLLMAPVEYKMRGLCFFDAGFRSFYTKERPVNRPQDLDGLKIRVMESQTAKDMVNGLGGSATPMAWGELYSGLQQGIVDGAENNPPSFHSSGHYEICKYYTLNEHTAVPDVLLMSTIIWEQLNDQEQAWVNEAIDIALAYQRIAWVEAEQEALEAVQAAGVEVIRPDKQPFMEELADMFEKFQDRPDLYPTIQAILATPDPTQIPDSTSNPSES
ncbi:TRAP transporter substrate-binding protein [Pontibacter sp. G13]|uniref:TRAP transporter substrate-binding protein n=1 Tax=Pontibacter sp. G13 TaxID=3074898 RepID=UPI00288BF0C5|nr:TRAP transporter substrate-binding protein [Pontibacter sp. G13]WNJ20992.1 TRAP transporter substrate-binding protein [Pontibacter sp. G13]